MTNSSSQQPVLWIFGILGIVMGAFYHIQLWQIGADGLSIVSHTTPYWDFNNLWSGGYFARNGHVDWLFNLEAYRENMRDLLGPTIPNQEWSYPPSMLLLGLPFSLLPVLPAYILWTASSILLLHIALRQFQLSIILHLALLLSPAVFINALLGQNGALLAALMLLGLYQMQTRPILAGICFGLMTIKPQYGLLLPVLLIASGNWKTFLWAAVTSVSLFLITALAFGFDIWLNFLSFTRPMMTAIMEAPYIQPYHTNAIPVFVFARALGANLPVAYGVQIAISLGAIITTWFLWRDNSPLSHTRRIAMTCVLTILATPYAYTYDMVVICIAIVLFFQKPPSLSQSLMLAPLWLFPLYCHILAALYGMNIGALAVGGVLLIMVWGLPAKNNLWN